MLGVVLFDLDGTLIDSMELIRRSYRHTLLAHRGVEPEHAAWLEGIGRPLRWQFARDARDAAEVEAMIATYRSYNLAHHDASVRAFPGVLEALRALAVRGLALGIVTSKLRSGALRGLDVAGLADCFDVIVAADDVDQHKPHPAPVLAALAALGGDARDAIMVGDSPHDLASGRAAGTRTAAVAWGPFPREALLACAPDHWLEEPSAIASLGLADGAARVR